MSKSLISAINNYEVAKRELINEMEKAGHKTTAKVFSDSFRKEESELRAMRYLLTRSEVSVANISPEVLSKEQLERMLDIPERQPSPTVRGESNFDC